MSHRRRITNAEPHREAMRCVADGAGSIVFLSPSIGWMVGQSASAFTGRPVHSVMQVVSRTREAEIDTRQSGFFDVAVMRGDRDPVIMPARMDWVRAPNGKSYTVIWLDPDQRMNRQKQGDLHAQAEEFAVFISENEARAKKAVPAEDSATSAPILTGEGELKHFLNLTTNMLAVYQADRSFVRVNPAFNRVLGYSDDELKLFPFSDMIHPEERDHILQLMQKIIHAQPEEEVRIDFECRTRCKDGTFRWIEWLHKAIGGFIYIVGRDITEIKQHEAELLRREEQLSEAQKIGRMGHWFLETGLTEMEWSDQIYSIFGVDKNSFRPTIDAVTSRLSKKDLSRIYRTFRRAMAKKKDYELEFSLRRQGGGTRYVRVEGRCKLNAKTGEVEALFGIMQDITERTLHERALHEAKEAAETAYASKTRFLANMSHELRTPLNAIIGFSEMMQRQLLGPVGNARYLDYINSIRTSGEHLLDLINDILDMSKIEIGKYELDVEELNVGKIIRLAIHMVEGRAHELQVRLSADDIPDNIQISADRRALMQILLNLMSNAVKFTRPGGKVDVRCYRDLGAVMIEVADTGIGIPKDKIDIVTLPFEQASSEFTRNHEGSGLGLAITKELVELHGGTLSIASEVDVGTTVSVLLPERVQAEEPETQNVRAIA